MAKYLDRTDSLMVYFRVGSYQSSADSCLAADGRFGDVDIGTCSARLAGSLLLSLPHIFLFKVSSTQNRISGGCSDWINATRAAAC